MKNRRNYEMHQQQAIKKEVTLSEIPQELKDRNQWVAWRGQNNNGKTTKKPINPYTGALAKTNDPDTWGSFEESVEYCQQNNLDGIGFVSSEDDPYVGIDIDDCIKGTIDPKALQWINFFNSYAEISPSGKGFINALNDYWKPLFIFLFFSGARIAEDSGLKWKRVNLQKGAIKISKNLARGKGKASYKETKTDTSNREIRLPDFIIEALREQRKITWKGDGDDFVFKNKAGNPIHRQTLNESLINPTLKKIGITKKISIKDTRASFISNSLDVNERLSFIQAHCGFTKPRMIIDLYYRHVPAEDDGARMKEAWHSTRKVPDLENAKN